MCRVAPGYPTEKYFRNLIKSHWNQIVYTIFRLIKCLGQTVNKFIFPKLSSSVHVFIITQIVMKLIYFKMGPVVANLPWYFLYNKFLIFLQVLKNFIGDDQQFNPN